MKIRNEENKLKYDEEEIEEDKKEGNEEATT